MCYARPVKSRRRRSAPAPVAVTLATRTASPFAPVVHTAVTPPIRRQGGGYTWSLETIRAARDAQLRGQFDQPVRMAEAFRTNDALFTAYQARVATQSAIRLLWQPADSDAGRVACARAERTIQTAQHARESILGTLANHGLAIGYVEQSTVDDPEHGPTTCMRLTEWPLEHVRFNPSTNTLETRTKDNGTVTITHGDGRWVVFRKFGTAPWTQDACVLPGALVWASHGMSLSDWSGASGSHGQPKVIGTLREGMTIGNGETLTPEAQALLNTLTALVSGDAAAGIVPSGAEAKLLYNGSTAWQVFDRLSLNREKAAMRIYLGTDAALGSQGGAPGVDVAALFSVASTRIQGDLEALERGFREGMIEPWARMHGVATADVPTLVYAMPDADGERRSAQEASALDRLAAMVKAMKDTGLDVTQDTVTALVGVLGISVPCTLAAAETKSVPIQLAPTDVARVVKVREARGAQGLPPLGDERDELFISELEAQTEATPMSGAPSPGGGAPPATPAPGGAPTPEPPPGAPRPRVLPLALATRAGELDADGDGKINEAEAEAAAAAAAGKAIDGDGDGKLDEEEDEDPRITKSRKNIAKALEKYEKKQTKIAEAQKEFDNSLAEYESFDAKREEAEARTEAADEALEEAEASMSEAKDARESAESDLKDFDREYGEFDPEGYESDDERNAARSAWESERADGRKEHADAVDAAAADLETAKAEHAKAKDESKQATKAVKDIDREEKAASKRHERAEAKLEKASDDPGEDELEEALTAHSDTHAEITQEAADELQAFEAEVFGDAEEVTMTPEQEAKHSALTEKHAKAAAREKAVDRQIGRQTFDEDGTLEAPDPNAPSTSRDQAHAILTGPEGGQYYINENGEKEYV